MLTRKLLGFESDSRFLQLPQQLVVQLKRIPLFWWQWVVVLLLLATLSNSISKLIWSLLPENDAKSVQATIELQQQGSEVSALTNVGINKLVQLNLFGVAGAVEVVETVKLPLSEDNIDAENTRLALKLTGVTYSNVPSKSRAMIAHNNQQKSYALGDKLPGGRQVTLDKVLARRVILNNAGRYESLWLFEEPSKTKSTTLVERTPQPVTLPATIPDIEPLAQDIRVTPHREGIQVKLLRNMTQFEQLGLKTGDVVSTVNGRKVNLNPEEMRALYLDVLQSQTASVQVIRNGTIINIDVDLSTLNLGK